MATRTESGHPTPPAHPNGLGVVWEKVGAWGERTLPPLSILPIIKWSRPIIPDHLLLVGWILCPNALEPIVCAGQPVQAACDWAAVYESAVFATAVSKDSRPYHPEGRYGYAQQGMLCVCVRARVF